MIYSLDGIVPEIHPDAWIAPGVQIIGRVRIKAGASIWFGAVLRGDNEWIELGEGSNIQENSVLHTDLGFPLTIGANCTIGHKALLHGCRVEDGALVGMNATVMNGAVIGKESLVGAGALVTEGKHFDTGSMILGSPAKFIRTLDEAARQKLLQSAKNYQENAKRFRLGMKEI